jgi:hypothetical protein
MDKTIETRSMKITYISICIEKFDSPVPLTYIFGLIKVKVNTSCPRCIIFGTNGQQSKTSVSKLDTQRTLAGLEPKTVRGKRSKYLTTQSQIKHYLCSV